MSPSVARDGLDGHTGGSGRFQSPETHRAIAPVEYIAAKNMGGTLPPIAVGLRQRVNRDDAFVPLLIAWFAVRRPGCYFRFDGQET